jgi:hypothetical protein
VASLDTRSELTHIATRVETLEATVRVGSIPPLTAQDKALILDALSQLIAQSKDELAGRGLFAARKAKAERRQQLQTQIEAWQKFLEKLRSSE